MFFNYLSRPRNSCQTLLKPKKNPLGPKTVKNDPKIKSKSKVRIERTIDKKNCSTTWVEPETVFEPYLDPKNSPLRPQKVKNYPKK